MSIVPLLSACLTHNQSTFLKCKLIFDLTFYVKPQKWFLLPVMIINILDCQCVLREFPGFFSAAAALLSLLKWLYRLLV